MYACIYIEKNRAIQLLLKRFQFAASMIFLKKVAIFQWEMMHTPA